MVGYGILNGIPTPLGTATRDGSITLYLTEDPLLVVAATQPGAPTDVRASSGSSQSSVVSWTAPDNDGGEPISSFSVSASPGGSACTATGATATSCTLNGLHNGTSYTLSVRAINGLGSSVPSSTSITMADPTPESPNDEGDGAGDENGAGGSGGGTVSGSGGTVSGSGGSGGPGTNSPNTSPTSTSPSVSAPEAANQPPQPTRTPAASSAPEGTPDFALIVWVSVGVGVVLVSVLVSLLVANGRRRFHLGR
jgi:hypothetical protein